MEENKENFSIKCNYCDKAFVRKTYLSQHVNRIHKKDLTGERTFKSSFTCIFCDTSYGSKGSLLRHIDVQHLSEDVFSCDKCTYKSKDKSELKKHKIKIHLSNGNVHKRFICTYCKARFSIKENLQRHVRNVHNIQINKKCPLCSFISHSKTKFEINSHFSKVHEIMIEKEEYNFDSIEEFSRWKDDLETKTLSFYVKRKCSTATTTYECHRKGYVKNYGGNHRLKTVGSCKINGYCPSEIRVTVNDNSSVSVSFVPTHVGHTNDLRFARLTSVETQFIASQLLQKISYKPILRKLRNLISSSNPKRLHLARKGNIVSIEKNLNLYTEVEKNHLIRAFDCVSPVDKVTKSDENGKLNGTDEMDVFIKQDKQKHTDQFSISIDQDVQLHSMDEFTIDIDTQLYSMDEFSIDIDQGTQTHNMDQFNIDETFTMEPISEEVIVSEISTVSSIKKAEIKEMFELLLSKITTKEQMEFVLKCVKELLIEVEAL